MSSASYKKSAGGYRLETTSSLPTEQLKRNRRVWLLVSSCFPGTHSTCQPRSDFLNQSWPIIHLQFRPFQNKDLTPPWCVPNMRSSFWDVVCNWGFSNPILPYCAHLSSMISSCCPVSHSSPWKPAHRKLFVVLSAQFLLSGLNSQIVMPLCLLVTHNDICNRMETYWHQTLLWSIFRCTFSKLDS